MTYVTKSSPPDPPPAAGPGSLPFPAPELPPRRAALEPALPRSSATMALREFTDSAGASWRVWGTVPRASGVYDESLKAGWLTFEDAGGARRRLAPIPSGWEDAPTDRLELMCRAAEVVQRKSAATRQLDDADVSEEAEGRQAP